MGASSFPIRGSIPSAPWWASPPAICSGGTTLVDFRTDPSATIPRRGRDLRQHADVDVVTVAQQFYQTHEDAYDYLVIYNNMEIAAWAKAPWPTKKPCATVAPATACRRRMPAQQFGSPRGCSPCSTWGR